MKESDVQKAIIQWCRLSLRKDVVYWSTPNERKPSQNMNSMAAMGMLGGVADLTFMWESVYCHQDVLFIEVKRPTTYKIGKRGKRIIDQKGGNQSDSQEEFQRLVTSIGCDYYLVDNLDDFIALMKDKRLTNI
ncbi:MAG: hypothetical protein O2897_05845 [bacterium]|nr:hypothetical protein [bacterium]